MTEEQWEQLPNYEDAAIFDALKSPLYIVDVDTYEVLYINVAARQRLGLTKLECTGKKCHELLRQYDCPCENCCVQETGKLGYFRRNIYQPMMEEHYQVEGSLLRFKGRHACIELCVNIEALSEQKKKLELSLEAETVLNQAIHMLYVEPKVETAIAKVLEKVSCQLKAERGYMVEVRENRLFMVQEWCSKETVSQMDRMQNMDAEIVGRWLGAFGRHEPVVVLDIEDIRDTLPMEYDLMLVQDIRSYAVMPIFVDQNIYGYIGFDNIPSEQLDAAKGMLSTLAYFIGTSLVVAKNRRLMEEASYTDAMTGVANRNAYVRDLEQFDKRTDIEGLQAGVLFFDMNGLKKINDEQGHRAGDRVITGLADTLALFFRKREIYRTGGDEFVIVCMGMPERLFHDRMLQTVNYLQTASVDVSIGHAWSSNLSRMTLRQIISRADEMMYQEKERYYENITRNR